MKQPKKDFVAIAIADYEAMSQPEQGKMVVQILEDQPILMGFITNLADDFTDAEHEALVDSAVILINAFVSAGIPIELVPHQMVEEIITERMEAYEKKADDDKDLLEGQVSKVSDSPLVFEDLKNRAVFKTKEDDADEADRQNFLVALDTIISIIERSASISMEKK